MEYKEWYRAFNNYVKQFDLKEKWIMYKFHHTYRVVEYAKEIANSISLSKEDTDIAILASLLHDVARFKQYTEYRTYNDKKSFDHGDEAIEVLKENNFIEQFTTNKKSIDMVFKAIKNHNKFKVEEMDEKSLLITNIVRDADKLDIMTELGNTMNDKKMELDSDLINCIMNGKLPKISNNTSSSEVLTYISFIYDINFKFSIKYLNDNDIIKNKFNLLKIYFEDKRIDIMEEKIKTYIKERL